MSASLVHSNHVFGVNIDTKTDEFRVEVKNTVEVSQEEITENINVVVLQVKRVLSNGELANAFALMQISLRFHLKDCITNVETNWFQAGGSSITSSNSLAENLLTAVKLDSTLPLLSQRIKFISWDCNERTTSINNGRILLSL